MILAGYQITIRPLDQKYALLSDLVRDVLGNDPLWHFFLNPEGITLRIQKEFCEKVEKYVKGWGEKKAKISKPGDFEPKKHEYFGVRFVAEDIVPLFHELSLFSLKYPRNVTLDQGLERICHIFVNQAGIHDFEAEAKLYAGLVINRARLAGKYGE